MGAQRQRLGVRRREVLLHQLRPEQPRRAQLGDLHEEVHADRPEEAEPGGERIDVEAHRPAGPHVLDAVGERVGELEVERRPRLLHVVAGDRDRVEPGHLGRGVGEDVRDDPHRGGRRVDVGVADHELLEDVVLDGPGELVVADALFLGGDDVQRQHRQHGAVHGHGDRHPVQRDAVEEHPHVEDRVDRHPGHADVAGDAGVVGVVAAVGREVERDRQALLSGGEVAAVEGVGVLGGGEPGVLADRPRLVDVHRRVRAAQERGDTGVGVEEVEAVEVLGAVDRRDVDALRCRPLRRRRIAGGGRPRVARSVGSGGELGQREPGEVGDSEAHAGVLMWRASWWSDAVVGGADRDVGAAQDVEHVDAHVDELGDTRSGLGVATLAGVPGQVDRSDARRRAARTRRRRPRRRSGRRSRRHTRGALQRPWRPRRRPPRRRSRWSRPSRWWWRRSRQRRRGSWRSWPGRCARRPGRGWRGTRSGGRPSPPGRRPMRRGAPRSPGPNGHGAAGCTRSGCHSGVDAPDTSTLTARERSVRRSRSPRCTSGSATSANSLTPVIGSRRVATRARRVSRTSAMRSCSDPSSSAAGSPPSDSS